MRSIFRHIECDVNNFCVWFNISAVNFLILVFSLLFICWAIKVCITSMAMLKAIECKMRGQYRAVNFDSIWLIWMIWLICVFFYRFFFLLLIGWNMTAFAPGVISVNIFWTKFFILPSTFINFISKDERQIARWLERLVLHEIRSSSIHFNITMTRLLN